MLRLFALSIMALAAHAATIQMTLDAFKFAPAGTSWSIQLKSLTSAQSLKISNIKLTNLTLKLTTSAYITGTAEGGITLSDIDLANSDLFIGDLLQFEKTDGSAAATISFEVSAETVSLFVFGPPPASSDSVLPGFEPITGAIDSGNNTGSSGSSGTPEPPGVVDTPEPASLSLIVLPLAACFLKRFKRLV